jgi:hypothetical protein
LERDWAWWVPWWPAWTCPWSFHAWAKVYDAWLCSLGVRRSGGDIGLLVEAQTCWVKGGMELVDYCTQGVWWYGRKKNSFEFLNEFWWVVII